MCNVFSFARTFDENGRTFGQNGRKMADDQLLFIALLVHPDHYRVLNIELNSGTPLLYSKVTKIGVF